MTSGALDGKGVVITRPAAQCVELAAAVARVGGRPLIHPVIAIVPPEDKGPLARCAAVVDQFDWVVFTSVNAVDAFGRYLPAEARPRAVAAVGQKTAATVRSRWPGVDLVAAQSDAEDLLHVMLERLGDGVSASRILIPRAAEGRDVLPQGLKAAGAAVELVTAYRTVVNAAANPALKWCVMRGEADLLTFASPSAVEAFEVLTEGLGHGLPAVCIGRTTQRAASERGFSRVSVARDPSVSSILDTLAEAVMDAK